MKPLDPVRSRRPRNTSSTPAHALRRTLELLEERAVPSGLPSNLAATGITGSAIRLSWTDGSQPGGYYVERSADAGSHWAAISGRLSGGTGFSDTGLPPTSAYYYRLSTGEDSGGGAIPDFSYSLAVKGHTLLPLLAPDHLSVVTFSSTQLQLTWSVPAGATGTVVERSPDGTAFSTVATAGGGVAGYTDGGLTPGTSYTYRVEAVRRVSVPNEPDSVETSAASAAGRAGTLPALVAPSGLQAQAVTPTALYLGWSASADPTVIGYQLQRSADGTTYTTVASVSAAATAYADAGLTANSPYSYRIGATRQYTPAGSATPVTETSAWSSALNARTLPALLAPAGVAATNVAAGQVLLGWTNPTGPSVSNFRVWRSSDGVSFTQVGSVAGTVLRYADTGLASGTAYTYRVDAYRQVSLPSGPSFTETVASALVHLATLPTLVAPSGLQAQAITPTALYLGWSASADPTVIGYQLQRSADGTTYTTVASTATTAYTDTGLTADHAYFYRLSATRQYPAAGDPPVTETSAWSSVLNVRTLPTLLAPAGVAATALAPTQILLQWTNPMAASAVTAFQVWRSGDGVTFTQLGSVAGTATSYTDTGLVPDTTYTYKVLAFRQVSLPSGPPFSDSAASTATQAHTLPFLYQPLNVVAVAASGSGVYLEWFNFTGTSVTQFQVQRSSDGVAYSTVATLGSSVESYLDAGIQPLTQYFYRISASRHYVPPGGAAPPYDDASDWSAPTTAITDAGYSRAAQIGTNLAPVNSFTREWVTVDAFKMSGPWAEVGPGPFRYDAQDDPLLQPGQSVVTYLLQGLNGHYPGGTYVVTWQGSGTVLDNSDDTLQVLKQLDHRLELLVLPGNGGLSLKVTASSPFDPVRNIHVWMPGYENAADPFHPLFVQRLSPYSTLRFMDWERTNNSTQQHWSDRAQLGDLRYTTDKGVPLELMIQLANETHSNPWFALPAEVDDDYVRNFAQMVRDRLDPSLKVYLQYTNEQLDGNFSQTRWVVQHGLALGYGDGLTAPGFAEYAPSIAGNRYYADRAVQMFGTFEEVFGGHSRLVRVLESPLGWDPWNVDMLTWHNDYQHADAFSVGGYFGLDLVDPTNIPFLNQVAQWSVAQVLDYLRQDIAGTWAPFWQRESALAAQYGLVMVAAEGGQTLREAGAEAPIPGLADLYTAVNRDPGLGGVYQSWLDNWIAAGGDLVNTFDNVGRYDSNGNFGLLEYQDQDWLSAPKYQATEYVVLNYSTLVNQLRSH